MRLLILSLLALHTSTTLAANSDVIKLVKQLNTSIDDQERVRAIALLGTLKSAEAVKPLCQLLKDSNLEIRLAATNALGQMQTLESKKCLKSYVGPDSQVTARIDKLNGKREAVQPGALYLAVDQINDVEGSLGASSLQQAEKILSERLSQLNVSFAPAKEDRKAAEKFIKTNGLRAYKLSVQIRSNPKEKSMSVEMLVLTYPGQSLKGSWRVKAAGAEVVDLLQPMLDRVVNDVASELDWKNR